MLPRVNLIKSNQGEFLSFGADLISQELFRTGVWEESLLTITKFFLNSVEKPLVIDIGANLGAFTVPIAAHIDSSGGKVVCSEPQRTVYYQLCGNIFLNRLDNVLALNQAVGDLDGIIQLPRPNYDNFTNVGGFSLDEKYRKLNGTQFSMSGEFEDVAIITLDNLALPRTPALIKLDVEGYELNVLKGATKFLKKHAYPPIFFEAWNESWFTDEKEHLLGFIRQMGYEITHINGYDHVAQHPAHSIAVAFLRTGDASWEMSRVR